MGVDMGVSINLGRKSAGTGGKSRIDSPMSALDIVIVTTGAYAIHNECTNGLD